MELTFTPSPDVTVVLHALLDIFERRAQHAARDLALGSEKLSRSIKILLSDLPLPGYLSQTDPVPRLIANEQLAALETANFIRLIWIPGEKGHLLQAVVLQTEFAGAVYPLLNRTPAASQRNRLETLLLGEKFRFPKTDWRGHAIQHTLAQLKAGKSPAPFSLADWGLNLDLLTVLAALPTLTAETPFRVFSVRVFNDSKRLEAIKNQLVSLCRAGSPEWKRLPAEEVLRELNLVPNPNYIHLAGSWQLGLQNGEILSLGGFSPSIGFPAAQTINLQNVSAYPAAILCIENLTTFHEFIRAQTETDDLSAQQGGPGSKFAVICTYGNPSPAVRRILRLIPPETPIFHWSDLDYGGFNILSQLRRLVSERIEPYHMDIATLDANLERACPLTISDRANLKKLLNRPELRDVHPVLAHLLKRGLKLEQEGVENGRPDYIKFSSSS